mmetsp:Transcript_72269/g.182830  ORF Transcript_72269/g.182830 Transcript_72269/m.182830 type:complete len:248 (+) Transcript_72269:44-787(+)
MAFMPSVLLVLFSVVVHLCSATLRRQASEHQVVEPERPVVSRPGDRVLLCGLAQHTALNGRAATVLRWREDTKRFTVRLEHAGRAQLDAARLVALPEQSALRAGSPPTPMSRRGHQQAAAGTPKCSVDSLASAAPAQSFSIRQNATVHPRVDNENFHEGCSEACDDCFIKHLKKCVAVCQEGCQVYCKKSTAGIPGCSTNEYWSAQPGGTQKCTWGPDDKESGLLSCNKYRHCESEGFDGCPEAYLY